MNKLKQQQEYEVEFRFCYKELRVSRSDYYSW